MKNNRALLITIIIIVALFIGAIIFVPQLSKTTDGGEGQGDTNTSLDISKYDVTKVIPANEDNGGIDEHIKGNISKAKVVLYEYADYQCSGCATVNPWMKELKKEYGDDLAIVFRVYPLTSIHPSAISAASAVEAAGLQGYWEEFGDLVFANQAEWFYATGDKLINYFANYLTTVSQGNADIAQFKSDMASDKVKAKVNFDKAIAESLNLNATPSFVDDAGNEIDWTTDTEQTKSGIQGFFRNYINKKLGK
ncbi:thioredoxin domain-containing protein [Candidatus Saccharibacteria bacterium]|nr:thioredoxin domain-containing protein [Candidatus Saccharibacteria bacterium]